MCIVCTVCTINLTTQNHASSHNTRGCWYVSNLSEYWQCFRSDILATVKFREWLDPPDPSPNHNNARDVHHENTGQWLLEDERYITWKQKANSFLWINGICEFIQFIATVMATKYL